MSDVYVDPVSGLDTNLGKDASPFKKASAVVPAGSTVWLVDGAYNAANQGSSVALELPEGATLSAKHAGLAIIEGLPIVASGAANAVAGMVFDKGTTLAASNGVAATPTLTVTNVEFKGTASASATLSVAGKTKVTLAQQNFTGPLPSTGLVTVAGAGDLVIIGATFDGLGGGVEGFEYQLIGAAGTSKLTLDGVTMKNFGAAVAASGRRFRRTDAHVRRRHVERERAGGRCRRPLHGRHGRHRNDGRYELRARERVDAHSLTRFRPSCEPSPTTLAYSPPTTPFSRPRSSLTVSIGRRRDCKSRASIT